MAAALMPVLQTTSRAALAQLPNVLNAVKSKLPGAYNQVSTYFSKTSKTPEQMVNTAVTRGDKFLGQAILETMMKNGVSADFISTAAPLFTAADLSAIQVSFANIDSIERGIADQQAATITGDNADVSFAHDNVHIERLCRGLGISSTMLADLVTFVNTRGPAQIKRYQAFEKSMNRKPL